MRGRWVLPRAEHGPYTHATLLLADRAAFFYVMPMVSVNVSQLLLAGLGTVREFDFFEPLADPAGELHLRGPIRGHAKLTRTPEGILVHSEHAGIAMLECARCLEEALTSFEGVI